MENKMTTPHKYADVIKAFADGKPIEFRYRRGEEVVRWRPSADLNGINLSTLEWRIKPENVEHFLNIYGDRSWHCYIYETLKEAHAGGRPGRTGTLKLTFNPDKSKLLSVELVADAAPKE
jgi:hypothetical protein